MSTIREDARPGGVRVADGAIAFAQRARYHRRRRTLAATCRPMPRNIPRILLVTAALAVLVSGCRSADAPPVPPDKPGARFSLPKLPKLRIPRVFKISVQQGNVITQQMVDKLEPGMTRRQVIFVLGQPVVSNPFRQDTWDYVYWFKAPDHDPIVNHLTLHFDDDVLTSFTGDLKPSGAPRDGDTGDTATEGTPEQTAEDSAETG